MDNLKQLLNISPEESKFTKKIMKPKNYNRVKDNVFLQKNYNFMGDLLFLPTTKEKYKYLFVVVDLASDEFDFEPLKDKLPEHIVKAVIAMKKRKIIMLVDKNKGQSIRTDSGSEFKGKFSQYLYNHSILHRIARPNRHIQLANVERLNGVLGSLLNGYMNSKEKQTGKTYREWTDVLNIIRTNLNDIRRKKLPDDIYRYIYPTWNAEKLVSSDKEGKPLYEIINPKYKVGDLVYVALETPENTLGEKLKGNFRNGDYRLTREPHKILKLLYYHGAPYYRYLVNGFDGVSFQEDELRPAIGEEVEKFKVKALIGRKKIAGKIHYLVWWKGYKKFESTWEAKTELMKDIPSLIQQFDEEA